MRPTDGAFGRPRPSADHDLDDSYTTLGMSSFHTVSGSQMTYCVTDEAAVNASLEQSLASFTRPRDFRKRDRQGHVPAPPTSNPASDSGAGPGLPKYEASFHESAAENVPSSAPSSPSTSLPGAAAAAAAAAAKEKESTTASTLTSTQPPALPALPLHELLSRQLTQPHHPQHHPNPRQHYRPSDTPMSGAQSLAAGMSQPMTPILLGASGPASAFSGVSSRRNSLISESLSDADVDLGMPLANDSGAAIAEGSNSDAPGDSQMMDSGCAPQLVMPSIKMPSRRPFSDEGKGIGRLKLLVAGESGSGKTSLIKAMVQSCTHIVHVDPITPQASAMRAAAVVGSGSNRKGRSRTSPSVKTTESATKQITEVYASTKPFPDWWSELDGDDCGAQKRRRKSLGDSILDRNICFVDTPGFGAGSPKSLQSVLPVVQYVESHLERMSSNSLSDADLLSLLGGDGGSQVDAVLYLISAELKAADVQYLRLLSPLTNIIPLLAWADTMTAEQVASSKERVLAQLVDAGVRPFGFSSSVASVGARFSLTSTASGALVPTPSPPFAISSATGSDSEIMDASLLMSPEYVEPLVPSELDALVSRVFSADGASWLRHSAARKYLQWRSGESVNNRPQALYRPLHSWPSQAMHHQQQTNHSALALAPFSSAGGMLAHASVDTEQHYAQVRLTSWAADLQRSLANEQARYEALARGERAIWLTERLGECVQDGTLVPIARGGSSNNSKTTRSTSQCRTRRSSSGSSSSQPSSPLSRGGRPHVAAPATVANHRTLVGAATQHQQRSRNRKPHNSGSSSTSKRSLSTSQDPAHDPLGLLEVAADLRAKGWVALEVLGSIGLLGGLAMWFTGRYWDATVHRYDWVVEQWCCRD